MPALHVTSSMVERKFWNSGYPEKGSDHELLIAKFRLKLRKVGKTTKPFRYDLYNIPYDYTVEVKK